MYAKVLSDTTGPVYVDCVQLEAAETASRYNIIENGDFRFGANNWIMSEYADSTEAPVTLSVTYSAPAAELDRTAFRIVGDPEHKLRIRQEVPVSGKAGDTFVLAGWARGEGVPLTSFTDDKRQFTLRGTFMYTDGTADDVFEFKFNPDTGGELVWQYAAGVMVAKKPFSGIKIQVLYDFGANTIYFDGIQLYKEEFGNSYTYNDKGNVTSVKDLQGQTTQYEYASNNTDLLRVIQDNKAKVTYTYDDYHNVKTATTEEGIVYEFEYDAYGNNTSVSIGSGDTKITSIAEYTDDFNRLEATTNAQGRKTLYSYHPDTNVLEWVQYPMDTAATRTEYTYDEMYRTAQAALTTDTGLALSAEYTYDNDLLMSIETASTTYDFAYGNFALRSSVDIGNWNLAEYSYESGTNRLLKLDYGNGDKVQYTYDDQGRVTKQTYEDNAYVTYKYDNSGALATVYDSETNTTSTYYYDFTDRMMKYVEKSGNNTHSVGYTYDDINNLTALVETVSNQEYTTSYSYDGDNRLTSLESDNVFQSYTYDAYGRVTQKTAKNGDQTVMDEAITYRNAGPGGITAQPFQLIYTGTNYSTTFGYLYNTNDNITYVNQDGNTTYYYYDSANQLIREDNSTTDTTTLWTYDAAGNILRREVYPFSDAVPDPDAKISQVEYTYGDSDWGDLLTEYNGVEITYDGIGNPVNDGTWTYTWQHGRQLASMSRIGASEQWEFTYNAGGLRTQRTNGERTYNYTYLGDQLTHMTVGEHTMHFTYDGAGSPLSVTYGSETYYYVTDLQGDIVTILESDSTAVVYYAYDAWGNLISTTGDMADTLGFYNPLRYRGYVYDEETELYYLQSRYYNPEMGRFINADGFTSTGQGVLGNNMFAYCGNNSVCNKDITGTRYIDALSVAEETEKEHDRAFEYQKEVVKEKVFRKTYAEELAVLEGKSNMYKGVEVDIVENDFGSLSFGKIFLNSKEPANMRGIQTLRHEYGHTIQKEKLGTVYYSIMVVLPSFIGATLSYCGKLNVDYYSLPWEFEADMYGNVPSRGGYESETLLWYFVYRMDVYETTGK